MADRVRRPHPFRAEQPRPAVVRELLVRAITSLSPRYVRVEFGGPELGAFMGSDAIAHPEMTGDGFDDVAVLCFPAPDGTIARPRAFTDGRLLPDELGAVLAREYTVRELDVAGDRLVIDVILHEHGVASDWTRAARVGDPLIVAGPRMSSLRRRNWMRPSLLPASHLR